MLKEAEQLSKMSISH